VTLESGRDEPLRSAKDVTTASMIGPFDLLPSIIIVESGLDVPRANRMVVHLADVLGWSTSVGSAAGLGAAGSGLSVSDLVAARKFARRGHTDSEIASFALHTLALARLRTGRWPGARRCQWVMGFH
jgi:hypothetical protein